MLDLNENNLKNEVDEYDGLCLIDLYADWCGPCRMLAPTLEELEGEYPNVKFCRANVDFFPDIARRYAVEVIPFVALVRRGELLGKSVGYVPKQAIASLIEKEGK